MNVWVEGPSVDDILITGWTVEKLARTANMSRAVFAERFTRTIGMPPMQYLLQWRVALAKDLLRGERPSLAEVADRVGYQSAIAFTTAFTRVHGCSPRSTYALKPRCTTIDATANSISVLRHRFCCSKVCRPDHVGPTSVMLLAQERRKTRLMPFMCGDSHPCSPENGLLSRVALQPTLGGHE